MIVQSNASTTVTIDGTSYLYFGGTNYLGIAHRPELLDKAAQAFKNYGFSAGASRLTSGENSLILSLEKQLAEFGRSSNALVMPAGFIANSAVVDGVEDFTDVWVVHTQAHGSITAAISKSRKPVIKDDFNFTDDKRSFRQRHNLSTNTRLCVFAEPIDVMSGSLLHVPSLLAATEQSDLVVLDEAHSFGVLGKTGYGAQEHFAIDRPETLIRTGTFSKALGTYGGFILANKRIIDAVKLGSSAYKASTPLTPVVCAAAQEALRLVVEDAPNTVDKLKDNLSRLNNLLTERQVGNFIGQCIPIYNLANSPAVARLRDALPDRGICVPTVTSYFADYCEIGLRWTIQAGHSEGELQTLVSVISDNCSPQR